MNHQTTHTQANPALPSPTMDIDLLPDTAQRRISTGTATSPHVRINGCRFRTRDWAPTARQLLATARLEPTAEYKLFSWPDHGPTQALRPDEVIALPRSGRVTDFLAVRAESVSYFALNGECYAWAGNLNESELRQIARIPPNMDLWLERRNEPAQLMEPGAMIDLNGRGFLRLHTSPRP